MNLYLLLFTFIHFHFQFNQEKNIIMEQQQLNLDLTLASVPKTVSHFLNNVAQTKDMSQKLSMLDDLVHSLEDEMKKVLAFKRELPLSILLLNDGN